MNKERFLELVNLSIDNEISHAEAAELESELRVNASFRRTYEQYLRLHKGTVLLFENAREGAPASPRLAQSLENAGEFATVRQQSKPTWWVPAGALGTFAAAALAIVVTEYSEPQNRPELAPVAAAQTTAPAAAPVSVAATETITPSQEVIRFNQWPESIALQQTLKLKPINKVQAQPFVFSPEWRQLQDQQAESLKLEPVPQQEPDEMTALQFKR